MKCAACLAMVLLGGSMGVARAQDVDQGGGSPPQVRCSDGTMEAVGADDCSEHGGIAREIGSPMTKATPATVDEQESARVAPATPVTASPAMVRCRNGQMVELQPGACANAGGVDKTTSEGPQAVPGARPNVAATPVNAAPYAKSELSTTPPASAATAEVRCKDGSLSRALRHTRTCLGHAGVAEWLTSQP
jgi:hypothetical protein